MKTSYRPEERGEEQRGAAAASDGPQTGGDEAEEPAPSSKSPGIEPSLTSDAEQQKREVSLQEFKEIVKAHAAWLDSAGREGAQADLQDVKMAGWSFQIGLENVNLERAVLKGADCTGTQFAQANLRAANLREANLSDTDLSKTRGLVAEQLAGAKLSRAKLPGDVAKFEALENLAERSQIAKRLFASLLLGCIYALLTVATTTDVRLLTNSASSPLPIIQTQIPIVGFYFAAPVVLVGLYLYFLLYLQRLWESLAKLPAIFPDGTRLDEKAYPWLLNGLVCSHFRLLKDERPPLSALQTLVSLVFGYWVVPFTLVFIWGRYLPRHDWWGTHLQAALLVLAFVAAFQFQSLTARTLSGEKRKPLGLRGALRDSRSYARASASLVIAAVWWTLSYGTIEGHHPLQGVDRTSVATRSTSRLAPTVLVPRVFEWIQYAPYLELTGQDVSLKPPNWTGDPGKENDELALVRGARLRDADLRYASAERAFLAKVNLQHADLEGAFLFEANLRGAYMRSADLERTDLGRADCREADFLLANLHGADLWRTKLQGADLSVAQLQGVDLGGADLDRADLRSADLHGAKFADANLKGADFREAAGLRPEEIKSARNWQLAFFHKSFLEKLGLPPDHNETLPKRLEELEKASQDAAEKSREPTER